MHCRHKTLAIPLGALAFAFTITSSPTSAASETAADNMTEQEKQVRQLERQWRQKIDTLRRYTAGQCYGAVADTRVTLNDVTEFRLDKARR